MSGQTKYIDKFELGGMSPSAMGHRSWGTDADFYQRQTSIVINKKVRDCNPFEMIRQSGIISSQRYEPGSEVVWREMDEIEVQEKQENDSPKMQEFGMSEQRCFMEREAQYMLKLSPWAIKVLQGRGGKIELSQLLSHIRDSSARGIAKTAARSMLLEAITGASCDNYGVAAGRLNGDANTGVWATEDGAAGPITVPVSQTHQILKTAAYILRQQGYAMDGMNSPEQAAVAFGDLRFQEGLNGCDMLKELSDANCENACKYVKQGFYGMPIHGIMPAATSCMPTPNLRGRDAGYVVVIAKDAFVFDGFNSTFEFFNGGHLNPGDKYAYGTFHYGHLLINRRGVVVFRIVYDQEDNIFRN